MLLAPKQIAHSSWYELEMVSAKHRTVKGPTVFTYGIEYCLLYVFTSDVSYLRGLTHDYRPLDCM